MHFMLASWDEQGALIATPFIYRSTTLANTDA